MQIRTSKDPTQSRAAIYVRMSTEHQDYSIANQTAAIEKYARALDMVIVKRFVDPGRSGLTLSGRPALRNLLFEVVSGNVGFEHVLVYDVSRWGRFLDTDESAYYEYTCKKGGAKVHYCVEPFANDGSVYSSLLKSLKRIMAGEYSRELSGKVFSAQARLAQLGFRQGGVAGYALRRMLVDRSGNIKGFLQSGDRKGFQSDRILLTAGPEEEVQTVRQIFRWFAVEGLSQTTIARRLNSQHTKYRYAGESEDWTRARVGQVLTNPKYTGTIVYNRTSGKLRTRRIRNPTEEWVCREGAFEAIVDARLFSAAKQRIKSRLTTPDCQRILERLRELLERSGRLSTAIINSDPELPCVQTILKRFESLPALYKLLGYTPKRDVANVRRLQKERGNFNCLGEAIVDAVASGRLDKTFTISALKAACPGWSKQTYGVMCALYSSESHTKQVKLVRVGRGEYELRGYQTGLRTRFRALDDHEVLETLNQLLKKKGRLSEKIIAEDRNSPGLSTIVKQFGSMSAVYKLLGYSQKKDQGAIQKRLDERIAIRGTGTLAQAICGASRSGLLPDTFTADDLRRICPGWAYGSYHNLAKQYADKHKASPIQLELVRRGEYRVANLAARLLEGRKLPRNSSAAYEIHEAVNSGRLSEVFTLDELRVSCPGWQVQDYTQITSRFTISKPPGPIKLARVGRGQYQLVTPPPVSEKKHCKK